MAIHFELRAEDVQRFAKKLKQARISYAFTDVNAMDIFLSAEKRHCLHVDFFHRDEFFTLKTHHDLSKREINRLARILYLVTDHFRGKLPRL